MCAAASDCFAKSQIQSCDKAPLFMMVILAVKREKNCCAALYEPSDPKERCGANGMVMNNIRPLKKHMHSGEQCMQKSIKMLRANGRQINAVHAVMRGDARRCIVLSAIHKNLMPVFYEPSCKLLYVALYSAAARRNPFLSDHVN